MSDKGRHDLEHTFAIYHNLMSSDPDEIVKEFEENDVHRPSRATTRAYHEIVSFSPEETEITMEDLEQLAHAYIDIRGASNAKVLAVPHVEDDHLHIHFVISGVESGTSTTLRMDNAAYRKIRLDFERYVHEHHPHIQYSYVYAPELRMEMRQNMKPSKMSMVDDCKNHLLNAFQSTRSVPELALMVAEHPSMELYYRNGKPQGVLIDGKKHRWKRLGLQMAYTEYYASLQHDQIAERVQQLKQVYQDQEMDLEQGMDFDMEL